MGRYINPFTDWGFKRLFGQEFSKDLLINFLNDLFEGEFRIKDVTFKDKEQLGDSNDLRGCIFDIYCVTDDDKHFIVEMQNRWVPFFVNRSSTMLVRLLLPSARSLMKQVSALLFYISLCRFMWFAS